MWRSFSWRSDSNMVAGTRLLGGLLRQGQVTLRRGAAGLVTSTEMPELGSFGAAITSHEELHRFSVEQPDTFWSVLARSRLSWSQADM